MAKKLGDSVIALIIFVFIIAGFSTMFIAFDGFVGANMLSNSLATLDNETGKTIGLVTELSQKIDNTSTFNIENNLELETRGSDAGGLINILEKNILTSFFKNLTKLNLPGMVTIISLISLLAFITVVVLFLRSFWGEGKH